MEQKERKRDAAAALADRDAAVAELERAKRHMREQDNIRASKHAIKSFTLEALGGKSDNAGGPKGKQKPF